MTYRLLAFMFILVGYFILPQPVEASDGFSGSINTACRFEPSLRQYLQTTATGSDPAYDWIGCPNEALIPPGLQPGVKEFSLGSLSEPNIYDRLEIRGVTSPVFYRRVGSGIFTRWHRYRQSIRLVIERIDGGQSRTVFDQTFDARSYDQLHYDAGIAYHWLVEPNNPAPGECNQPGIDQFLCNAAKVIDRGNLNHAHYRYTAAVVGEIQTTIVPLTYNPGDYSGGFTLNVRKNTIPAPGPVTLDGASSCDQQTPLHRLTWSASSDATSYAVFRNGALLGVQPERVYEDRSLTAGGSAYRYRVQATNASGWVDSNEVGLTAQQCFDFSVRIEPPAAAVQSGSDQSFRAVAVDNLGASLPVEAITTWSLANPASGDLSNTSDPLLISVRARAPGDYPDDVAVSVTYRGLTRSDAADLTVTPPPTTPPPTTTPPIPLVVTLSASPTTVYPQESITVTWTVTAGTPNDKDWVGLYQQNGADRDYIPTDGNGNQAWIHTHAALTGTFTLAAPTALDTYVFRYFENNTYTRLAESNQVQVIARPTTPPPTTSPPTTPPPTTPPPTTPPPTTPPPSPEASVRVEGDIFGRNQVANLTVTGPSIIASEEILGVSGTPIVLPGYAPTSSGDWAKLVATMHDHAARLISEAGKTLSANTIGGFNQLMNLNSRTTQPLSGDIEANLALPEGGVWIHDGNLTLREMTFYNRGTLIIRNGDLTIDGPLRYGRTDSRRDSLGIIILNGDLIVTNQATKLVGVYFIDGTATLTAAPAGAAEATRFDGSIAAEEIRILKDASFELIYDARLGIVPPPGFTKFVRPTQEEIF